MLGTARGSRRVGTWASILTREYAPRLAPAIRWLWTPLGSLGNAAIAALLCGLVLHPRGFVVLFGLLTVIVLGVVWPWLSVLGLAGNLGFDRIRVREGESVGAWISLRNRLPWDAWGLVVEDGCCGPAGRDEPDTPATGLVRVPGCRKTDAAWQFIPGCRGIYPARAPRIATGFPFGIWEAARPLDVSSRLIVWPRTFAVGPISEAAAGSCLEGSAPRDRPGSSGDILGVRPYRRGDSLRRIHWPQTARQDQLVICEMQRLSVPRMQVVVDTHEDSHAGSGRGGSREWAIRVAASVLEHGIAQGADVEAVFCGQAIAPRGGPVGSRRAQILDGLAGIDAEGIWTLDDLLELAAGRRTNPAVRVVVTTDLGLRRSLRNAQPGPRDRFIVLKAAAFARDWGGRGTDSSAPPGAAWIWIDDPERVPSCVQRAWEEVPLGI